MSEEQQIRSLMNEWLHALRNKDVDKLVSVYAEDAVFYDIAPPLRSTGTDELRKGTKQWFSSFDGPIGYEFGEISITAGRDLGFAHSINHLTGKRTNGEQTDIWMRVTVGFTKIDGRWLVTHEHVSVPLYMDGSNKAAVDLKP